MSDVLAENLHGGHAVLHGAAAERMAALDQRYTASRRALVDALLDADRPLTITEILAGAKGMPQSSAYRNLTVLCEAGVARRLPGVDDLGRFELAEDLAGHHHHLQCTSCGSLVDFGTSPQLERALAEAARRVATETGYDITGHRLDFDGRCPGCH
ncbi:MAG: Fur family transcriptional regulator [Acidimicrobiales bacterium]